VVRLEAGVLLTGAAVRAGVVLESLERAEDLTLDGAPLKVRGALESPERVVRLDLEVGAPGALESQGRAEDLTRDGLMTGAVILAGATLASQARAASHPNLNAQSHLAGVMAGAALESLERAEDLTLDGAVPASLERAEDLTLDGAVPASLERAEDLTLDGAPLKVRGALESPERVVRLDLEVGVMIGHLHGAPLEVHGALASRAKVVLVL